MDYHELRQRLRDRIRDVAGALQDTERDLFVAFLADDQRAAKIAARRAERLLEETEPAREMTDAEWQEHLRDLDPPGEPEEEWTEDEERDYQQTLRDDAAYFRRER